MHHPSAIIGTRECACRAFWWVLPLALAGMLLGLGCGDGRESDTPLPFSDPTVPPDVTAGEEAFVADGTFAVMRVVALEVKNPDTAHLFTDPDEDWFTQQVFMYLISEWKAEGDGAVSIVEQTCHIDISVIGGVDTVPGPKLLSALIPVQISAEMGDGQIWDAFRSDPYSDIWGARLPNPLSDPLPQTPEDPTQWDQDGDGAPGVTVYLDVVDSNIRWTTHIAQRVVFSLDGTLVDADRVIGRVRVSGAEQVLLGASPSWLNATTPQVRPAPDASLSYFEAVRVGDFVTCQDLSREQVRLDLFDNL